MQDTLPLHLPYREFSVPRLSLGYRFPDMHGLCHSLMVGGVNEGKTNGQLDTGWGKPSVIGWRKASGVLLHPR